MTHSRMMKVLVLLFTVALALAGCGQVPEGPTPTSVSFEPTEPPLPTDTPEDGPPGAAVAISPTSGPPGTEIEAVVTGFPADTEIELGLGPQNATPDIFITPRTDAQGQIAAEMAIPPDAEPEQTWVVVAATKDASITATSNGFQVTMPEYTPRVTISPASGPARTRLDVVAEGYPPETMVEVGVGQLDSEYEVVSTLQTADDGSLVTEVMIPGTAEIGESWVVVVTTEDQSVKEISNVFEVEQVEYQGTVAISPTSGPPGTQVGVVARGFPPEAAVEVGIGRVNSEYDVIATGVTDADGRLETLITIPDFVEPEDRWVIVVAAEDLPVEAVSDEFDITEGPTPTPPDQDRFTRTNIYLIAVGDEGRSGEEIGCGDSVIPVEIEIEPTIAPLTAALEELLAIDTRLYGQSGLYNALYQSDLRLESVSIVDSEAVIRLSGTLTLGGVCDAPRVEAQLKETALQYSTVDQVSVFIDGRPLDEFLDGGND
mgnify:CR=1 FL=1